MITEEGKLSYPCMTCGEPVSFAPRGMASLAWCHEDGTKIRQRIAACRRCRGAGVLSNTACPLCRGAGVFVVDDHVATPRRS